MGHKSWVNNPDLLPLLLFMEIVHTTTTNLNRNGRPKFIRNKSVFTDLDILESIASETLQDGQLVLTVERAGYALSVGPSTIQSLIASGELPSFYVGEDRKKRPIRIPAEAVLAYVRRHTPIVCEPRAFKAPVKE